MGADRVNRPIVLLASAERSATSSSDDQVNEHYRGVEVYADVGALGLANEVQSVTVSATGGTFTLTYDSEETAALAFDISAVDMQTALEGLASIGVGNVSVTGGPGDATGTAPYLVEFIGALANTDLAMMVSDPANLTGTATAPVAEVLAGGTVETPSITVKIEGKDEISGDYYALLTSAAVTTAVGKRLVLYPGITAAANLAASDILPFVWRVTVTHGDTDGITYSVGATLIR